MQGKSCYIDMCTKPAKYYCTCSNPNVNFCRDHQEIHEYLPGDHRIIMHKYFSNLETKQKLLKKISQVKAELNDQIDLVLDNSVKNIKIIKDQTRKVVDKLLSLVKFTDEILQDIRSISEIPYRRICSPLHSILLSEDSSILIDQIKSPIVTFPEIMRTPPSISFSTFPYFLFNYTDLSTGFSADNTIKIHPINKTIVSNSLNFKSSRSLNIGNHKFLFTGGKSFRNSESNRSFILDINTESVTELPPLKTARKWHAMAWIEGNPGVIGGECGGVALNSVEVFENEEWVERSPINVARSSCTAAANHNAVWVVGGCAENTQRIGTIEKLQQKEWKVLKIVLEVPCSSVGLYCSWNDLLLIGGKSDVDTVKNLYCLDAGKEIISKPKSLEITVYCSQNQFVVKDNQISGFVDDSKNQISLLVMNTKNIYNSY